MSENLEVQVEEQNEKVSNLEENFTKSNEPLFTMKDLLGAGVHYGHRTMRWNPKMAPYIYGTRNGLHIIDLMQTAILINEATKVLREVAKKRGKILFVCTKKQGSEAVAKMAENCGQYYVNYKWLGGMLTNWKTISQSIRKIKAIDNQIKTSDENMLVKKEVLKLEKQKEKLEKNFDGIKSMGGKPDLMFVIDVPKESLAISEAKALNIPVMAITDTNADPDNIDYIIPGNDDSIKAIQLYCNVIENTLKGVKVNPVENKIVKKQPQSQKKSKVVGKNKNNARNFDSKKVEKDVKAEVKAEETKAEEKSE